MAVAAATEVAAMVAAVMAAAVKAKAAIVAVAAVDAQDRVVTLAAEVPLVAVMIASPTPLRADPLQEGGSDHSDVPVALRLCLADRA